jgi:hypothetical protein
MALTTAEASAGLKVSEEAPQPSPENHWESADLAADFSMTA